MPSKPVKKKAVAKKPAAKKSTAYSCRVCGSYAVISPMCGCGEEHVFICCGQPMKKAGAGKSTPKKSAKK